MTLLKPFSLFACLAALLSGCSSLTPTPEPAAPKPAAIQEEPASQRPANFEPETLYMLLVAELAGQRQRYDVLLSNYLTAAKKTRDPGLAERAVHIAAAIKARKATLMAAELWHEVAPENPKAKQVLAAQLIQDGQLKRAVALLEELLKTTGNANFEHLTLSSQQLSQSQRSELLVELDRLLKAYPENAQLLTAKTVLLQLNGRSDEALATANSLHRLEKSTHSLSLKAKLNHQLGQTNQALSDLKKALKKSPDDKTLRILYAQMLIDDKQLTAAQKQFERLIEQSPRDEQLRLTLALLQVENGDLVDGNRNLTQLLDNPEFNDEVRYYLGQSAEKDRDTNTAIEHYRQVAGGSKFLPAYHRLGTLLLEQNDIVRLQTLFSQVRETHQQNRKNLYLIEAELLTDAHLIKAATNLLNQALREYPDDINLLYSRAMTAEKINDLAAMEKDLRAILSLEPDNAMVLNALGYTLVDRTTRYEEALALIIRANELKPNDPAITDSLGWAQFRLGNYDEAIRLLEKAHADFPDHEVAAHLGEALWVTGQRERAREVWREALKKQPDSTILKRVIDRLSPNLQ